MMAARRVVIKIYGRVQGVFFRDGAQRTAQNLGLTGWVRNEPDGTVLVVTEGEEDKLKELIKWCREGPPAARVDRVEVGWGEAAGEDEEFQVR